MTPKPPREIRNVVGDRTLIAIQAVNISRLSTHPVPIVPGTLLVVAGQGPKDSNGAGKSSFIAAITALLGDEQWRFASGAQAVSELLFNAELAAQGGEVWASADHGYIIGVFGSQHASTDLCTVWLRVNADAPHLELRWVPGLHLAAGASEAERVRLADECWQALPRSAGRRDFLAKDLGRVLYGEQVRCVSFLSTSVRSRVATNLLSQPLNEITPERIFGAIAALTGLDRELETERRARADEHAERARAAEALERLEAWEAQTHALIAAFDRRDTARARLEDAQHSWQLRAARRLVDGLDEDVRLVEEQQRQQQLIDDAERSAQARHQEIAALQDEQLDREITEATKAHAVLAEQLTTLGEERAVTSSRLDEARARAATLAEASRDADGRDRETAEAEHEAAESALTEASEAVGAAKGTLAAARAELNAAKAGTTAVPPQLDTLAQVDIPAAAPHDAVLLVVAEPDLQTAAEALSEHHGSVLLSADGVATDSHLRPTQALVIGDLTRYEARIAAAQKAVARAEEAAREAQDLVREARGARDNAARRLQGSLAAAEAEELEQRVLALRAHLDEVLARIRALEPEASAAEKELRSLRSKADNRDLQVGMISKERDRQLEARDAAAARMAEVDAAREGLALGDRLRAWSGTEQQARDAIAELASQQQHWDPDAWWHQAESALTDALRAVFPEGIGDEEMPEQVRLELIYRRDGEGNPTERERETFPRIAEGLASFLREQQEYERHQRAQIESQRAARRADFEAAEKGVAEAAETARVGRATVTKAIRARLREVAARFEELDLAYGGYGATLDVPTPEAPSEPEQEWRWRAVPRWRRADGQPYVSYNRRANTALMDEKAVKLVCAAALASAGGGRLCLVLDELGRNLGKEHRREAVALFRQIGESHGITVIGALQDDMEPYAIDGCGEYVKLRRSSDALPYNEPPVVIGNDQHADRVRALAEVLA